MNIKTVHTKRKKHFMDLIGCEKQAFMSILGSVDPEYSEKEKIILKQIKEGRANGSR